MHAGVLLDAGSWSGAHHAALYPYATPDNTAAAWDVLRRVCGAGLLLSAATAHCLLDAAQHVNIPGLMAFIKQSLLE
jgi:hypothetical protein